LFFLAALRFGLWKVPALVTAESFHSRDGILLAHMLLLGWATMIAMGASYQISQVLLRIAIYSRKISIFHLIVYAAGILFLLIGFRKWTTPEIAIGGGLVVLGVAAYAFNIGATYVRSKFRSPVSVGASLSLLDLCATVALGTIMGIASSTGWPPVRYENLFFTHMWMGLAGWMGGLVASYSLKLLPMFYVSRKFASKWNYVLILLYQAGVWLGAAGWWSGSRALSQAGLLCVVVPLGMLVWFARGVRKQSSGKQPVGAVRVADALITTTFVFALAWACLLWVNTDAALSYKALSTLILYAVLGWFTASILSYLSKIIPFLWWADRFRTKEQKKGAVLLSDMVPHNRLTAEMLVYLSGVGLLIAGNVSGLSAVAMAGILIMAAAAVIYMAELARVFRFR